MRGESIDYATQASMIFMSQSSLTEPSRASEWAQWYVEHLRIMRTVNGIDSAERFLTDDPGWPTSLAMYSIRSPQVFEDPYYLSIRGMGQWLPLIDRHYYRRNLFEGAQRAPAVTTGSVLLVADTNAPGGDLRGFQWTWLRSVGLDQTTPYRGIAVVPRESINRAEPGSREFAVYHPC